MRENIELYGLQKADLFNEVLKSEFGARQHPRQGEAYVLESQAFCAPRLADDHVSILSFDNIPLPGSLIEALVDHPALFPGEILVRWTQEQDLIFEATLGQLRGC